MILCDGGGFRVKVLGLPSLQPLDMVVWHDRPDLMALHLINSNQPLHVQDINPKFCNPGTEICLPVPINRYLVLIVTILISFLHCLYNINITVDVILLGSRANCIEEDVHKHEVNKILMSNLHILPDRLGGLPAIVHSITTVQVVVPRKCEVKCIHHFEVGKLKLLQPLHKDAVVDLHLVWVGHSVSSVTELLSRIACPCHRGPVHNCRNSST